MHLNSSVLDNRHLVACDLGYKVNDPCQEVANTGYQNEDANNESNDVLRLEVANDSVDTADECAEENLQQDLSDLGQSPVLSGQSGFCHDK